MWRGTAPARKTVGKWGKSLTLTVGVSEATMKDGDTDDLDVGLKTTTVGLELQ